MITIWKYKLTPTKNDIEMPSGAEILDIQFKDEELQMWARVNTNNPLEIRHFSIYATGEKMINDPGKFLATFTVPTHNLVFHVFEDIK